MLVKTWLLLWVYVVDSNIKLFIEKVLFFWQRVKKKKKCFADKCWSQTYERNAKQPQFLVFVPGELLRKYGLQSQPFTYSLQREAACTESRWSLTKISVARSSIAKSEAGSWKKSRTNTHSSIETYKIIFLFIIFLCYLNKIRTGLNLKK